MHGAGGASPVRGQLTWRWAQAGDPEKIYGQPVPITLQGAVGLNDGEPFVIMGLARYEGGVYLFSDYRPGTKEWLKSPAILRGFFAVRDLIVRRGLPVVALADKNEPDSDRLMTRLGFTLRDVTEDGGLYEWHS